MNFQEDRMFAGVCLTAAYTLLLGSLLFLLLVLREKGETKENLARWNTSPCGMLLRDGGFMFGRRAAPEELQGKYVDRGSVVAEIVIDLYGPADKPSWYDTHFSIRMYRTRESCQAWIKEAGIDLRPRGLFTALLQR